MKTSIPFTNSSIDSYGDLCTRFYDLDKPAPPAEAFAFFRAQAHAADGPVLEAMCGSGRFLIPLAQEGLAIDGVDASPAMLAACRARSGGLQVRLFQQRLDQLDLPGRYAAILIPAGSFGLLVDDGERARALERMAAHLLPGGRLVFTCTTPAGRSQPGNSHREVTGPDGERITLDVDAMAEDAEVDGFRCAYELFRHDLPIRREIETIRLRYLTEAAIRDELIQVGFTRISITKAWDGTPLGDTDSEMLVLSHRG